MSPITVEAKFMQVTIFAPVDVVAGAGLSRNEPARFSGSGRGPGQGRGVDQFPGTLLVLEGCFLNVSLGVTVSNVVLICLSVLDQARACLLYTSDAADE